MKLIRKMGLWKIDEMKAGIIYNYMKHKWGYITIGTCGTENRYKSDSML